MALFSRIKWPIWVFGGLLLFALTGASLVATIQWLHHRSESDGDDAPRGDAGFRDMARESGITFRMAFLPNEQGEKFKTNLYDHGCGVAVGDFNNDRYDDIFFCNQKRKCALYRNQRDGPFEDVTEEAGVGLGDRVCVAATWADYDGDGWQDLFVTSTRGGNVLFKNLRNGKFKDVTKQAGLTLEPPRHSQ